MSDISCWLLEPYMFHSSLGHICFREALRSGILEKRHLQVGRSSFRKWRWDRQIKSRRIDYGGSMCRCVVDKNPCFLRRFCCSLF